MTTTQVMQIQNQDGNYVENQPIYMRKLVWSPLFFTVCVCLCVVYCFRPDYEVPVAPLWITLILLSWCLNNFSITYIIFRLLKFLKFYLLRYVSKISELKIQVPKLRFKILINYSIVCCQIKPRSTTVLDKHLREKYFFQKRFIVKIVRQ